jgi:hypothetical protein
MLPADAIAEITTNIAALQLDPNAAALNLRRRRAARPGFAVSPYGFRARSRSRRQPSEDQQAGAFNAPILADHAERPA